jgi:hypothetical protein
MRGKDAGTLFAVVSVLVLLSTSAEAVTGRQKRDCKADYNRYTKTGCTWLAQGRETEGAERLAPLAANTFRRLPWSVAAGRVQQGPGMFSHHMPERGSSRGLMPLRTSEI